MTIGKRFIDTNLFDDEWFCELSKEGKLAWLYLITKCDHAGVFDKSHKLAEFQMSIKNFDLVIQELNGKIKFLPNNKIFIPKFITFQYPNGLDPTVKPQKSVIDILTKLDINIEHLYTVTKDLPNTMLTAKDKDKDIRKDVDVNVKVKDVKDVDVTTLDSITTIYNNILEKWNSFVLNGRSKLPKVVLLSNSRKNKLKVRLEKKEFDFDNILKAIDEQPWLFGNNDREWCISFDWIIENDTNFLKVLERKYKYLKTEVKK
jgi:hypothetical protein